ncbi:hypothetical protein PCE1_004498 [Barthelona sp. PCE]
MEEEPKLFTLATPFHDFQSLSMNSKLGTCYGSVLLKAEECIIRVEIDGLLPDVHFLDQKDPVLDVTRQKLKFTGSKGLFYTLLTENKIELHTFTDYRHWVDVVSLNTVDDLQYISANFANVLKHQYFDEMKLSTNSFMGNFFFTPLHCIHYFCRVTREFTSQIVESLPKNIFCSVAVVNSNSPKDIICVRDEGSYSLFLCELLDNQFVVSLLCENEKSFPTSCVYMDDIYVFTSNSGVHGIQYGDLVPIFSQNIETLYASTDGKFFFQSPRSSSSKSGFCTLEKTSTLNFIFNSSGVRVHEPNVSFLLPFLVFHRKASNIFNLSLLLNVFSQDAQTFLFIRTNFGPKMKVKVNRLAMIFFSFFDTVKQEIRVTDSYLNPLFVIQTSSKTKLWCFNEKYIAYSTFSTVFITSLCNGIEFNYSINYDASVWAIGVCSDVLWVSDNENMWRYELSLSVDVITADYSLERDNSDIDAVSLYTNIFNEDVCIEHCEYYALYEGLEEQDGTVDIIWFDGKELQRTSLEYSDSAHIFINESMWLVDGKLYGFNIELNEVRLLYETGCISSEFIPFLSSKSNVTFYPKNLTEYNCLYMEYDFSNLNHVKHSEQIFNIVDYMCDTSIIVDYASF